MKLEIYYDYLCEYCARGHQYWSELLPQYPKVTAVWRPCEAHPRVSEPRYGRHSDLAIQGLLYLESVGGDTARYNGHIFSAAWHKRENIEDVKLLARYAAQCGAEEDLFAEAIRSRCFEAAQQAANSHAWGTLRLSAVPSYLAESGERLDAVPGVGVTKERLCELLEKQGK